MHKTAMKYPSAIILLISCFAGCSRPACFSPPVEIGLRIEDAQHENLLDPKVIGSYKDSVFIFYKDNAGKLDTIRMFTEQHTDADHTTAYQADIDCGWQSLDGQKTFLLRRSASITDTLFADYQYTNAPCGGIRLKTVKFNGTELQQISDKNGWHYLATGRRPGK